MGKIPAISQKRKICIICEGFEEDDYMNKLQSLGQWSSYEIKFDNARGNGNIPARYNALFADGNFDLILVFCDTDELPNEPYDLIKEKINNIFGNDDVADEVIIFANPCTMQIFLAHFENILLTSHKKVDNRADIKRLTNIGSYDAKEKQRQKLFNLITKENYQTMKLNIASLKTVDTQINSTNFLSFIECFENNDVSWIDNKLDIINEE